MTFKLWKKKSKSSLFHTFSMISYFMRMFDVFFSFWQKINIQRSSLLQLFVFHSYSNQILFLLTKFLSEKLISSVVIIPYRLNFLEEVKNVSKTSSIVYFLNGRRDGGSFLPYPTLPMLPLPPERSASASHNKLYNFFFPFNLDLRG